MNDLNVISVQTFRSIAECLNNYLLVSKKQRGSYNAAFLQRIPDLLVSNPGKKLFLQKKQLFQFVLYVKISI